MSKNQHLLEKSADALLEMGRIEESESNYEEALINHNGALKIYQKIEHVEGEIKAHTFIAEVYLNQSKYDEGLLTLQKALALSQKYGSDSFVISNSYL